MGFTSNFQPFESALPLLARLGRQAEESFARGPDWFPHAVMDLRILAETTQRQLSGKVPSGSFFGDAVIRLREQGTLTPMEANALQQLWRTGSSAAHGERSFDRSEVITAFGLALLVCRFALIRAGKGPVPEADFREPPPADEEIRKLQDRLRAVQSHASGEHAERLQVEERRREFEELARQFEERASEAEKKITEQSQMLEAARGKLSELEGQVRDEEFARQEIERHQQLAADLERELQAARRGVDEARKGADEARQRVELGADAYQLDYPRDDWMRIPAFFEQLVRHGDGPFQGYDHVKLCGEGSFGVVHRIAPHGGGSPVVVKLPRQPSDPADAERLAGDWERELQRWTLLSRCRKAPVGVVRVQRISPHDYPAWVVLELIDGEPLGDWAGSRGGPDPVHGLRIMQELARRLDALGNVGFGYTDLHQGNVLVREESGVLQPVLIDAGAATPRQQPPEWRGLRLRDLTTERGGPTRGLVRGLSWLLARLTCLTLLGSEVTDVVTAGSEDDSLGHLELGTPATGDADGPSELQLRRMLTRRFGAHGSEHVDTTLVADLILRGLSSDPSRRPDSPGRFAEFVGRCFRSG